MINEYDYNHAIMGRICNLISSETDIIISDLSKGKSTLEISKIIGRYPQTVKRFVAAPTKVRKRVDIVTQGLFTDILCHE